MATKSLHIAVLLSIAMASIFSTCKKGGLGCANTVYNFQINIKAYPDKDSIQIGDTLWLDVNAPTNLLDHNNSKTVDYSGAENLGTAISFVKFTGGDISNPGAVYAANDFNYHIISGSQVDNSYVEGIREYLFKEENKGYNFKLAIIPQQVGTFSLGVSNASNIYRGTDKCTKAGFEIDFDSTNQHLYFLEKNRPGYQINDYERTHLYCFKVY